MKFEGGYAQAGYVLTGEAMPTMPATASYGGIKPANPFSLDGGGWGAWEIAGTRSARSTSTISSRTANGVAGGRQTIYTAALNWYVNGNVRFMLDYLHGDIAKQVSATNFGDAGAKFDAVAMRTQVRSRRSTRSATRTQVAARPAVAFGCNAGAPGAAQWPLRRNGIKRILIPRICSTCQTEAGRQVTSGRRIAI